MVSVSFHVGVMFCHNAQADTCQSRGDISNVCQFRFFHLVSSVVFPWVVCLLRSFRHSFMKRFIFYFSKEVKKTRVMTMGVFVTPHDSRCLRVQWGGGGGGRVGLRR